MNFLFTLFLSISIALILNSDPSVLLASVGTCGGRAVAISASLAGIYAFWMGIIKILEKTPALSRLERLVYPIVIRIFPGTTAEVRKLICLNISANMLGAGGAGTPVAIAAIKKMQEGEKNKELATKSMLMLFILSATSLQILPTTVISLRTAAASTAPASIILPTLIASVVSTAVGVGLVGGWTRRSG